MAIPWPCRLGGWSSLRGQGYPRLPRVPMTNMVVSVAALVTSENMVRQHECNISSLTLLGSAAAFGSAGYIVAIHSDT